MNKLLGIAFTGFSIFSSSAALALCATQWYEGRWNCSIDGRPSEMAWEMKVSSETKCENTPEGRICHTVQDICKMYGWFREQNARWIPLKVLNSSTQGISFTYTGDNTTWILRATDPSRRQLRGQTTWAGRHYPLNCTKR